MKQKMLTERVCLLVIHHIPQSLLDSAAGGYTEYDKPPTVLKIPTEAEKPTSVSQPKRLKLRDSSQGLQTAYSTIRETASRVK
jgi:hypothetical protein